MSCRETTVQTAKRPELIWTSDTELPGLRSGARLPGRLFEEALAPLEGGRVVAKFASGAPAAVASSFGQGKTLALGSYISAAYESRPDPMVQRFFGALLDWAGVEQPVEATGGAEVRFLDSGRERLMFVFNHKAEPAEVSVRLRGSYKATDLVAGEALPRLEKRIAAQDVWVVRLE